MASKEMAEAIQSAYQKGLEDERKRITAAYRKIHREAARRSFYRKPRLVLTPTVNIRKT